MTRPVMLNIDEHKDLRVITDRSEAYGDNTWFALTFPLEFRTLQAYYPIFFQKHAETGRFLAIALLGLREGENLFLEGDRWTVPYIPLSIKREPFLIGHQKVTVDGQERVERVIHIDMDNPRVNSDSGERLFMEFGGNSPYLDKVADMLDAIHHGLGQADDFMGALERHELLESFTLEVQLENNDKHQLVGLHTINEDKLGQLDGEALAELHAKGYLASIYMVLASHSNVMKMLAAKNKQVSAA
ncbi:SapC family protein [Microbulbifer agarilyticus]|uniref:SapC family protein n=1 Tax=Microbulbifer agarilyticus TaxID=260552 RepID=UPI001C9627AA|nr:SapC family protein [Microbulbifer agarilyticus]MBY6192022.1 SapC family protein [Microbulbifer agarilyticus]